MAKQCYSDIECKIIKAQIERRNQFRKEFLKQRTDPCKHSQEAGYVVSYCPFIVIIDKFNQFNINSTNRFS